MKEDSRWCSQIVVSDKKFGIQETDSGEDKVKLLQIAFE